MTRQFQSLIECPECGTKISPNTPFSDWLRIQPRIDSRIGYVTTNLDFIWRDYKSEKWILIEEKRHMSGCSFPQTESFSLLDRAIQDPNYFGFWLVKFEKTSPEDGFTRIFRTDSSSGKFEVKPEKEVDADGLADWLRLDWCK